jgi:hypothetical protein
MPGTRPGMTNSTLIKSGGRDGAIALPEALKDFGFDLVGK